MSQNLHSPKICGLAVSIGHVFADGVPGQAVCALRKTYSAGDSDSHIATCRRSSDSPQSSGK